MKILDQLRAAAEAQETATPGPWYQVFDSYDEDGPLAEPWPTGEIEAEDGYDVAHCGRMENVGFLVAASSIPFARVLAVIEAAAWWLEVLGALTFCMTHWTAIGRNREGYRRMAAMAGLCALLAEAGTEICAALADMEAE